MLPCRERGSSKDSPRVEDRGPGYNPDSAIHSLGSHGQATILIGPQTLYLSDGLIMPIDLTWLLRESDLVITMQVLQLQRSSITLFCVER